jgi:hypothetical protein
MKTIMKSVTAVLVFALSLFGANVDGVWKADYTTPDGTARQSTFHLKANGDKLTGKVVGQAGEAEIEDGAVKGDDVSFRVVRNFGGNEVKLQYSGKVSGDELKLKVSFNENSFDIVAKRQSAK